jgi:hypothetical protein
LILKKSIYSRHKITKEQNSKKIAYFKERKIKANFESSLLKLKAAADSIKLMASPAVPLRKLRARP